MSISHATFSPEFSAWLETAEMEDIEGAYAENYKDAHGIKARWVYGAGHTREQFADMFVRLGNDIKEEENREAAANARFMALVESLGLTQWAADNGIKTAMDLCEYNYAREYIAEPEALPYEVMAGKKGY